MLEKGLNNPVTRQIAPAPKIHIPAALVAWDDRGPEKMMLAKETSRITRKVPSIRPWMRPDINFGEQISLSSSFVHLVM